MLNKKLSGEKIFLLLAILSFAFTLFGTIYVVDPDGTEDFITIQEAIDANYVVTGDTINVNEDTYYENITISKSIVLQSSNIENVDTTIIDGSQYPSQAVVSIPVYCNVNVIGLSIRNSTLSSGVHISGSEHTSKVESCNVYGNNYGFELYGALNQSSMIAGCNVYNNISHGFRVLCDTDTDICKNNIYDNGGYGIFYNGIGRVDLYSNAWSNNIHGNGMSGIYMTWTSYINCHHNLIHSNSSAGIYFHEQNADVDISNCTITDNNDGFTIYQSQNLIDIENSIIFDNVSSFNGTTSSYTISYSNIEGGFTGTGNIDIAPRFSDPTNNDYNLAEDSPCIDAGDPTAIIDTDDTRKDMGYSQIDQDLLTSTRRLKSDWNWLCFPRLKRVDYVNNNIYLPTFGTGKFLGPLWDDTVIGADPIQLKCNDGIIYWNNQSWDQESYEIESKWGFKLEMSGTATENQVGALESPDTIIELTNLDTRTWNIGYFLSEPGKITEVVPTDLLQYSFKIQGQSWCANYDPTQIYNDGWTFDTSYEPEVKCGQMVNIKIYGTTHYYFQWQEPQTTRDDYLERPMPEHFSFIEQINYLPIFLELNPTNLPQEIGLFINGECKGAAVVNQNQFDEAICQINAYVLEEQEENLQDNLEIVFYYDQRSETRTIKEYAVYQEEQQEFHQVNLRLFDMLGKDSVTISLRDKEWGEVTAPEFKFQSYNYPNPFNPITNIYYSLPQTAKTSLDIYNVRGQKVKSLVDGVVEKGDHQIIWNGVDNNLNPVSSGIYFYRLQSGENVINQKIILMK